MVIIITYVLQDGKWADNTAWIDNLTENRKKYKKLYEKIS